MVSGHIAELFRHLRQDVRSVTEGAVTVEPSIGFRV